MPINFDVAPYWDDFAASKNFYRILFKPGFAVQSRELTQAQSILQDQITKFADNVFKQNTPVTGGQVTTNFNCYYIKLNPTYLGVQVDVSQFIGILIQNSTGAVVAQVLAVASASGDDPPTLIVSYKSGGQFTDSDTIYSSLSNLACQAIGSASTGLSSVASIAQGVFYVSGNYKNGDGITISNGTFVQVNPQTIIVSKYSNTPTNRIGLNIIETIHDYVDDSSLLDPAIGASNYEAPGADRYMITLNLETRPLDFGDDDGFIEIVRTIGGQVQKMVDGTVYNVIDDYFAKRDYETNGDYVVSDFSLTPKTNADPTKYTMSVGKGLAYVHGYRVENNGTIDLVSDRARSTYTQNTNPIYIDYGSYFYLDNVRGVSNSAFDITTSQAIDLHCVPSANVDATSANTYNSTLVASGFIRGLVYDHNNGDDTNTSAYVYKAYVSDIQNKLLTANAVSATANTITLPSIFSAANSAYVGVNISITAGTDGGDFRTITAYNGSTKVATVNSNWTTTPDSTSVIALNFDVKDVEVVIAANKASFPATVLSKANINLGSKTGGLSSGNCVLSNPSVPEMLFNVGAPFVSSISSSSYTTQQIFRNIAFNTVGGSVVAQLNYEGDYVNIVRHFGTPSSTLSSDLVKQNYTVIVTNKGSNTLINNGDIICWTSAGRTITLDNDSSIATFSATDLSPFSATIIAKVFVENADEASHILRGKNLINGSNLVVNISGTVVNTYTFVDDANLTSTGQVYIQNAGVVNPGSKQSLYISDVKNIVKIIDTGSPSVVPTVAMLTNPVYDITSNYIFDNGQKDNYYDHASITLRPGAPKPVGNVLVVLNYYQHTGGDGYFSIQSYMASALPEDYKQIPVYTSRHGTKYALRDCLDFRPTRNNATSTFAFRYANVTDTVRYGSFFPVDSTIYTSTYSYYLARMDKLILTKDKSFQIIEGAPGLAPILPGTPDGSLVIANISLNPYTGFLPTETPTGFMADLSLDKVQHKRYTMQDIAGLETRINQVEYYTSLNALEQNAQSLQIPDTYGLNRFKNGILVDDFSSYATADAGNNDFAAAINKRTRQMTASQTVNNYPLKSLFLAYNMGTPAVTSLTSAGFGLGQDGYVNYFSLPYTTTSVIAQKLASRVVNVNPFSMSTLAGITTLSPNMDNWVDNNYSPALLITDPNLQVFSQSPNINVLSVGDWQTISGTTSSTSCSDISLVSQNTVMNHNWNQNWGFGLGVGVINSTYLTTTETTATTTLQQQQNTILGPYSSIGNTYALNNGYIKDVSILPWIRPQQVVVRSKGMLFNTVGHSYFDGKNVDNYFRKANVIELTNVTGSARFKEDDIIGYYSSSVFTPTGRVLGVHVYPGTLNLRLYVAADSNSSVYTTNGVIQNAFFDGNGLYQYSTATGNLANTTHSAGQLVGITGNTVTLSPLASSVNTDYVGSTFYIISGTGIGQSAAVVSYNGSTKVATLSASLSGAVRDVYSIGPQYINEDGSLYGVFFIPPNIFHTGERVLRVDNSTGGNPSSATTWAEGTFYASGLSTQSQQIDFGASPSGAKGTFTQTAQQSVVTSSTTVSQTLSTYASGWDPVAQTFIVDSTNFPNGMFLSSAKFFFRTKPNIDSSPIHLSIVGTLNGYPNGTTLDHSIVTMTPDQINISESPQYLDATAYTEFKFAVPIYIQPGVLYSLLLKSGSNEYTLWTASNGDTAISSSVKNLPTDPSPSTITKINGAPYVGALFISQNAQTWTADQNQSLMFSLNRCVFDINATPTIQFVVPNKLPQRTLVDQSVDYYENANNVISNITLSSSDHNVDAFNITTTDFAPTTTSINYAYTATLLNGTTSSSTPINPGKYGTSMYDNIYLNDGNGERILRANSNTSLSLMAHITSLDSAVSPIISDAGLSAYAIKWNINNCELSNTLINLVSGGTGYNANTTSVTVSSPTGINSSQAYATANISAGVIQSIYLTTKGSGYITTPNLTIVDANSSPGVGATAFITGETSKFGGPALAKYVTKKVVLDSGFDSGDLNVYITAYRPVNTDILVYYKILNRNDTQKFDDSSWQLMTMINNGSSVYSQSRSDLYEYSFAPGVANVDQGYVSYTNTSGQIFNSFSQFAIKIVLISSDATFTPYLSDLRAIALPSNTNTTV